MNTSKIDFLNTALIICSFVLAYYLPFELFIFAYAILGPLHYLTEMNWIQDKEYFVDNTKWIYIISICAFLISLPVILGLPFFESLLKYESIQKLKYVMPRYFNSLFFIAIVSAFAFVVFKKAKQQYLTIGLGVVLAILLHKVALYHAIIGIFLPTIIHVYLFTLFFMWYGNLKSNSKIGYANVLLLVAIPILISFLTIQGTSYHVTDTIKNIYTENSFHILNASLSKILGLSDGTQFFFYESIDLKIQMFIAFAYTYHYLNWFSKTTIIGWHKKLTQKKSIFILLLWIASVALYFYNYKIGLSVLLFLSLLHVFMEFPLNVISIRAIGKSLFKK